MKAATIPLKVVELWANQAAQELRDLIAKEILAEIVNAIANPPVVVYPCALKTHPPKGHPAYKAWRNWHRGRPLKTRRTIRQGGNLMEATNE